MQLASLLEQARTEVGFPNADLFVSKRAIDHRIRPSIVATPVAERRAKSVHHCRPLLHRVDEAARLERVGENIVAKLRAARRLEHEALAGRAERGNGSVRQRHLVEVRRVRLLGLRELAVCGRDRPNLSARSNSLQSAASVSPARVPQSIRSFRARAADDSLPASFDQRVVASFQAMEACGAFAAGLVVRRCLRVAHAATFTGTPSAPSTFSMMLRRWVPVFEPVPLHFGRSTPTTSSTVNRSTRTLAIGPR